MKRSCFGRDTFVLITPHPSSNSQTVNAWEGRGDIRGPLRLEGQFLVELVLFHHGDPACLPPVRRSPRFLRGFYASGYERCFAAETRPGRGSSDPEKGLGEPGDPRARENQIFVPAEDAPQQEAQIFAQPGGHSEGNPR